MWEEVQFQQLENSDHPMHISYDSDEESLENLEVSEGSLPLCFTSFQFIRDNFHTIRNQHYFSFDVEVKVYNELLKKVANEKPSPEIVEEIMQRITIRDIFSVQAHHDPLILEKENIASPKNFPANPSYHRS